MITVKPKRIYTLQYTNNNNQRQYNILNNDYRGVPVRRIIHIDDWCACCLIYCSAALSSLSSENQWRVSPDHKWYDARKYKKFTGNSFERNAVPLQNCTLLIDINIMHLRTATRKRFHRVSLITRRTRRKVKIIGASRFPLRSTNDVVYQLPGNVWTVE